MCIFAGDLVWINGPYECETFVDNTIFRDSLISHLGDAERIEADDGYIGEAPKYVKCLKSFTSKAETEFM